MALIVETGTGLPNADSYITIAFADTYHRNRGNTAWTGAKEVAIRQATEYIDLTFRGLFYGVVKVDGLSGTTRQALEWPRRGVYDEDTGAEVSADSVPLGVQKATAEIALVALTGGLYPDASEERVQRRRERAGRVEIETWVDGTEVDQPTMRRAKLYLRPYLALVSAGYLERA